MLEKLYKSKLHEKINKNYHLNKKTILDTNKNGYKLIY